MSIFNEHLISLLMWTNQSSDKVDDGPFRGMLVVWTNSFCSETTIKAAVALSPSGCFELFCGFVRWFDFRDNLRLEHTRFA